MCRTDFTALPIIPCQTTPYLWKLGFSCSLLYSRRRVILGVFDLYLDVHRQNSSWCRLRTLLTLFIRPNWWQQSYKRLSLVNINSRSAGQVRVSIQDRRPLSSLLSASHILRVDRSLICQATWEGVQTTVHFFRASFGPLAQNAIEPPINTISSARQAAQDSRDSQALNHESRIPRLQRTRTRQRRVFNAKANAYEQQNAFTGCP